MTTAQRTVERQVEEHPIDKVLRAERLPHILCPGCGVGTVVHCYAAAMLESGVPLSQHVCVSGIGCSGRAAGYVNIDSYHTTHGRSIPFALGIAVQKPELRVTVISGDGDLTAIGGNHFIHAARRNVDLTVICINNFNYGMTGGQAGPTTPHQACSSTTPYGCWDQPFNLPHLAHAVGASYVARWSVLHVRQLKEAMLRAMQVKGFSFIEVVSPCPTGFGRPNNIPDGLTEMQKYQRRCRVNPDADLADVGIDLTHDDTPIIVGEFVDRQRQTFRPVLAQPAPPPMGPDDWAGVRKTKYREDQNGS